METTTFTEFRKHAKHYFDVVERGVSISVMRHGRLIAKIVPVETEKETQTISWKKPALKLHIRGVKLSRAVIADRVASKA